MVGSRSATYDHRVDDLQDTLAAIDTLAVHQCGHCTQPLDPDAVSPDFCGQDCQQAWTARQAEIVDLVGYREPMDLAAHAANLVELESPEVIPPWSPCTCPMCAGTWLISPRAPFPAELRITVRTPPPNSDALRRLREAFEQVARRVNEQAAVFNRSFLLVDAEPWRGTWGPPESLDTPAEPSVEVDPMQRALELRRNRNTGPADRWRITRRIDPRRTR